MSTPDRVVPASQDEAQEAMGVALRERRTIRIRGGGTKIDWGNPIATDLELSTARLTRLLEHNRADFTIVVEPGLRLAELQEHLAAVGQRVALDPPLGVDNAATVGGVVATGDAGPLRHRYGTPRDVVLGLSVVLPGGQVAKAGGRVIKNVAGYDLAKLYTRSFGTLGLISRLVLRVHPVAPGAITIVATCPEATSADRAASRLATCGLEPERLDVRWGGRSGQILMEVAGAAPSKLAKRAARLLAELGLDSLAVDGADANALWNRQRGDQRTPDGVTVLVSGERARLREVLEVADDLGATVVARAAHGVSWVRIGPADDAELFYAIGKLRDELEPAHCAVLDAPKTVRHAVDPFGVGEGPDRRLIAEIKSRFDPTRSCSPGLLAERI